MALGHSCFSELWKNQTSSLPTPMALLIHSFFPPLSLWPQPPPAPAHSSTIPALCPHLASLYCSHSAWIYMADSSLSLWGPKTWPLARVTFLSFREHSFSHGFNDQTKADDSKLYLYPWAVLSDQASPPECLVITPKLLFQNKRIFSPDSQPPVFPFCSWFHHFFSLPFQNLQVVLKISSLPLYVQSLKKSTPAPLLPF